MRAIRQYEFGPPSVLRFDEVPDPRPGQDRVRIRVEAAGVHLLDTAIRRGEHGGPMPLPELPMTPGREVAGVVDVAGPGAEEWLDRRVVAHLGMVSGGYAELAVTDAAALFALPDHVAAADAVAMVGTGRTTMGILEMADLGTGDVVLVTAAAGGIGALLVQAARNAGASVVGVAGGDTKVEIVAGLGADVAVDYSRDGWEQAVRSALGEREITVALDGVGGAIGRAALELVGPGGRMIVFGWSSGTSMELSTDDLYTTGVTVSAAIGQRFARKGPAGIRILAGQALAELAAGRLTPLVGPPFALADAAGAHAAIEARATIGKTVLVP